MTSLYHWQGQIEQAEEWQLALKSCHTHLADLTALMRAKHPYDLPAITWVALQAEADTAAWIAQETGSGG